MHRVFASFWRIICIGTTVGAIASQHSNQKNNFGQAFGWSDGIVIVAGTTRRRQSRWESCQHNLLFAGFSPQSAQAGIDQDFPVVSVLILCESRQCCQRDLLVCPGSGLQDVRRITSTARTGDFWCANDV